MARQDLQYINLIDFTGGITHRYGTTLGHRPGFVADGNHDGSAQMDGTWQCYGDPKGGLRPLPRAVNILSQDVETDIAAPAGWPDADTAHYRRIAILDMCLMSPVQANTMPFLGPTPEALFVSYFWYRDADGGNDFRRRAAGRQYKIYMAGHPTMDVWNFNVEDVLNDGELACLAYSMWFTSRGAYNPDESLNIGLPQMRGFLSVVPPNTASVMHKAYAYPANIEGVDPAADATNSPPDESQDERGEQTWFIGHQGRSVFVWRRTGSSSDQFLEPFGADGRLPVAEAVSWSSVNFAFNRLEDDNIFISRSAFVEENPSGYGVVASVNASELFLVKNKGGGVVIRGSLDNPEVVKLPGLESVQDAMNIPAITPQGCYYGARSGVWLWTGGDSAECVSSQLDGFFWDADQYTSGERVGLKGRFAYSYPFLYAPNDWVMDVRTNGWFKLMNRADEAWPYMFYDTTWDGRVYATPGAICRPQTEGGPWRQVVADVFDYELLANEYQWKSQPFTATLNQDVEVKKVVLVAQGVGEVEVVIEGLGTTPMTETFAIDSTDKPVRYEKPTTMRATEPIVTIHSTATDDDDAAPLVYAVHLGYMPTSGIPASAVT